MLPNVLRLTNQKTPGHSLPLVSFPMGLVRWPCLMQGRLP